MKKLNHENLCGIKLSGEQLFRSIENNSSDNINNCHLDFNEPIEINNFAMSLLDIYISDRKSGFTLDRTSAFSLSEILITLIIIF